MSMEQAILELAAAMRYLADSNRRDLAGSATLISASDKVTGAVRGTTAEDAAADNIPGKKARDAELEAAVKVVEKQAAEDTAAHKAKEDAERADLETVKAAPAAKEDDNLINADDKVLDYNADVKPVLIGLVKKKGNVALKKLLEDFKVTKGDQLKAEQYADIVAQANKLAA